MKIYCIGDSLTYGYGVSSSDSWVSLLKRSISQEVINKGINGDTTSSLLCRWDRDLLCHKPDTVILMTGTNDFLMGREVFYVYDNIRYAIKESLVNEITPILLCPPYIHGSTASLKWSSHINYNSANEKLLLLSSLLDSFAKDTCFNFLDMYSIFKNDLLKANELFIDGIHPTALGHKLIFNNLKILFNNN